MALSHEPQIGAWALLIGLTLGLLCLPDQRRAAAWQGWLMGLGYFAVTLRWIIEPFLVDIARHGWMAPFALILMAGGLALFWGFAGWLARYVTGARPAGILWFAVFLIGAEMLRGHLFTGFPWALPSYVLIGSIWDVWFGWVGPYGVTGLLVLTSGITAYCLYRGWTLIWPGLVCVLFATVGVGYLTPEAPPATEKTLRIVQPNAPQHLKWDRDWMGVFFNRALDQTGADAPVDVVIWPETSVPSLLSFAGPLLLQMSQAARGAPVVAGIQREAQGAYFNSAIVVEGAGVVSEIYDKAHLVPFGEYIPFASVLRPLGLGTLVDQVAGFSAGNARALVDVEGLGRVRILICYEGIFPEEIATSEGRPDILLVLTNDAWFGQGPGPRQHLVQAQARAIEQGVPVIRSANTGISAVIDARGRIVAQLGLNQAGYLDAAVPQAGPVTLYARSGDWPLGVALMLCVVGGVAGRRRLTVDASGHSA